MDKKCSIDECGKFHYGRTFCKYHYDRFYRQGTLKKKEKIPEKERFWVKVNKTKFCWIWIAGKTTAGYGVFTSDQNKKHYAHRYSYEEYKGEIPKGLVLDHLCSNQSCVNPDHLEAVQHNENIRRGWNLKRKATCYRGHVLGPRRICRECDNIRGRKYRLKKKLAKSLKKENCQENV